MPPVAPAYSHSPLANWQENDPHYTSAEYAKILGESGVGQGKEDEGMSLDALQIQYVDYQQHCSPGGVPVCATNGTDNFYFENECHLEAHNLKLLFQHGTELEPTDLERCPVPCKAIKCKAVKKEVCGVSEAKGSKPRTFANECEMRRFECNNKIVLRIQQQGPCPRPSKRPRKKAQPRRKGKRPVTKNSHEEPPKVYFLFATTSTSTPKTINATTPLRDLTTSSTTTPRTISHRNKAPRSTTARTINSLVSTSRSSNSDIVYAGITDSTMVLPMVTANSTATGKAPPISNSTTESLMILTTRRSKIKDIANIIETTENYDSIEAKKETSSVRSTTEVYKKTTVEKSEVDSGTTSAPPMSSTTKIQNVM
ncbi:hypothetical protein KR018_008204 [Drosophila ironensis]|nr:hypothetical protein KR018_008204 [Drosophila ironensis]